MPKFVEWGELFSAGLSSVAARRRKLMPGVEADLTRTLRDAGFPLKEYSVEGYRKGALPRDPALIACLARYFKEHGWLSREWFERFLYQARYPEREALLTELFGATQPLVETPRLRSSLPRRLGTWGRFVGRQAELDTLLHDLDDVRWPVVSIEGMAGIGKTTLAIEAVYRCLAGDHCTIESPYQVAVWVTAKDQPQRFNEATMDGAVREGAWLDRVLDTVATALGYAQKVRQLDDLEKRDVVRELLESHRALIILDDFENMDDPQLLHWMMDLPQPTKVLITSRFKDVRAAKWLHLGGLEDAEALAFIRLCGAAMSGVQRLSDADLLPLVCVTEGNPKAIELALGHVKKGDSLEEMVDALHYARQNANDIFTYLFAHAWRRLDEDARRLLLAVSFFGERIDKEALGAAAGLTGIRLHSARNQLVDVSLLDVLEGELPRSQRYGAHTLVRSFAAAELEKDPEWERGARQRWVEWYLAFTRTHGGLDWTEWASHYDRLEDEWPNVQAVLAWCAEQGSAGLEQLAAFWDRDHLPSFAHICGYWDDSLEWTAWLIRETAKREDLVAVQARAMAERSWILVIRGRPADLEEAEGILATMLRLRANMAAYTQHQALDNLTILRLRQKQFDEALDCAREMEGQIESGDFDQRLRQRMFISALYWRGQIYHAQGDLARASGQFTQMMEIGSSIGWQRAEVYAQNWLADIAIAEGRVDEADLLISEALPISDRNKDLRRMAYFRRSLAYLQRARGNTGEADRWALEAQDLFERLGMQQEIDELDEFLSQSAS